MACVLVPNATTTNAGPFIMSEDLGDSIQVSTHIEEATKPLEDGDSGDSPPRLRYETICGVTFVTGEVPTNETVQLFRDARSAPGQPTYLSYASRRKKLVRELQDAQEEVLGAEEVRGEEEVQGELRDADKELPCELRDPEEEVLGHEKQLEA